MATKDAYAKKPSVSSIPDDRRIDGVAEVRFRSVLSPLLGRKQTKLAFQDEVNVFRRTLLYAVPPNSARRYDVAGPGEKAGARALLYLRRRDGVRNGAFRKHVNELETAASEPTSCTRPSPAPPRRSTPQPAHPGTTKASSLPPKLHSGLPPTHCASSSRPAAST